ncbi:MAG: hypothetical protein FWD31_02140 [Planctomycetaceae bacterium]|nr:hypothetical protein [Planctomycetaceae bacterium]
MLKIEIELLSQQALQEFMETLTDQEMVEPKDLDATKTEMSPVEKQNRYGSKSFDPIRGLEPSRFFFLAGHDLPRELSLLEWATYVKILKSVLQQIMGLSDPNESRVYSIAKYDIPDIPGHRIDFYGNGQMRAEPISTVSPPEPVEEEEEEQELEKQEEPLD